MKRRSRYNVSVIFEFFLVSISICLFLRNESSNFIEETCIEDERLKNLDPKMIELIRNEIMHQGNPVVWDDISGLEFAKKTIQVNLSI